MGRHKGSRDIGPRSTSVGGLRISPQGYVQVIGAEGNGRHKQFHIIIIEQVLGHALPNGAVTHHVNENKTDNRNGNLVVIQSHAEHVELHRKMRVRAAGGNPWADRLCACGPRPASEFYWSKARGGRYSGECKDCARKHALVRMRAVDKEILRARDRACYRRRCERRAEL